VTIDYDDQTMWGSGAFFKFETPGDKITGNLVEVTSKTFDATDTKPAQTVPVFHLEQNDGSVIEVTISYVDLKKQLRDMRPQVGDYLGIKYTRKIDKTMLFDVIKAPGKPTGTAGKADTSNASTTASEASDEIPF
jgi:hypothetical protein